MAADARSERRVRTDGAMAETLSKMRAELERCSDDVCVRALENVEDREEDVERAFLNAETGEWEAFGNPDGDEGLFAGEYLLPAPAFDPSGRYSLAERAAMYRYFDGKCTVSERLAVCLPDAEVPGGNGSIRDEVTPKRIIDYITGRAGGEDGVYSWGDLDSDADGLGDCDDNRGDVRPETVCGTTPHFGAALSSPVSTGGDLGAVRASDGTVVVLNTPSDGDDGTSAIWASTGDDVETNGGLGRWKNDPEATAKLETYVCHFIAQPPDCPHPLPALLYVQRCLNDDQLIYTGGWIIDDSSLYAGATTVLTATGPTQVVGVDVGDLDGDGFDDFVSRSVKSERGLRGARIDYGDVERVDGLADDILAIVTSRGGGTRGDDGESGAEYRFITHVALDAPVFHLMNAGDASTDVKFKAGAELSKSVN